MNKLADIKTFSSLVKYLRDELDWPIESEDFEELTFDFEAEELGIDPKNAAKIKKIKQLRPLTTNQPWGIFFIAFEPKQLPVVVLRKMLAGVVIKRRASANKAERAAWKLNDLLFISEFGESDDRQITLAHFSEGATSGEIPTLRVLGWDELDTQLKLQHVDRELRDKLSWRDGEALDQWRARWSSAFTLRHRQVINTAQQLAEQLAELAKRIRFQARQVLEIESELGPLTKLYAAFREALIHDLKEESFADMYAQTITYGLFSAAVSRTVPDENLGGRTHVLSENLADMVPITNPFLREMLSTFLTVGGRKGNLDFDELGIQEVVEVLNAKETDLNAVLRDFGNRAPGEDPVIHFYEHFLHEYDRQLKVQRGVFYTPQPVVSYIVRSVHELLQTEFGLDDGLASTVTWGEMAQRHLSVPSPSQGEGQGEGSPSFTIPDGVSPDEPFVQILDPATGTATFLVEVIDVIHRTLVAKWKNQRLNDAQQRAAWNDYVPQHLLPRLHGYELLMAPYAIAHMKIGLKLAETGYRFGTEERARIYLTNALEPWVKQLPLIGFDALAHEAAAVNEVKRNKRFTVVIGNPPYSINSCNLQESAVALVHRFRYVDGVKIQERGALKFETILQDDYVKFWGLGIRLLEKTPCGIIGLISNNGFLTNRVLRGVRKALLNVFNRRAFLDLHGNRSKGDVRPDGSIDENVFDIDQGVGISFLRKSYDRPSTNAVELADLQGNREAKYLTLNNSDASSTTFENHLPKPPNYLFALVDADIDEEYRNFAALDEAMPFNKAGFVSGRDDFAVDFEFAPLKNRIDDFLNPNITESIVRARFSIKDAGGYVLAKRRRPALIAKLKAKDIIHRVQQRPFDYRFVAYSEAVLTSPQKAVSNQLKNGDNLAFCLSRGAEIARGWEHIFCTRALVQHHSVSLKEVNYVFPLHIRNEEGSLDFGTFNVANFAPPFLRTLAAKLHLGVEKSGLPKGLTPEDIFYYAYALFYSPSYRSRYAEVLKTDFPRLPLTWSLKLFLALDRLGGELVAFHLLESPALDTPRTQFFGENREVSKVAWTSDNGGTVWIDATGSGANIRPGSNGFRSVPDNVWNFHIGGYQVCEKWLKDRKGRTLSKDDIGHYHKIVIALTETIRLMAEIDDVINQHGGWPSAFVTESSANDDPEPLVPFE